MFTFLHEIHRKKLPFLKKCVVLLGRVYVNNVIPHTQCNYAFTGLYDTGVLPVFYPAVT